MISLSHRAARILSVALLATAGTAAAYADADLGALELNKDYSLSGMSDKITATFTPTTSETVTFYGHDFDWYSDAAYSKPFSGSQAGYDQGVQLFTYNVTAGTTYYIKDDYYNQYNPSKYLRIQGNGGGTQTVDFTLNDITPAQDSYLTSASTNISLKYSAGVRSCTATMKVGTGADITLSPMLGQATQGYVQLPISQQLKALYDGNQVQKDDPIVITVNATPVNGEALTSTLNYKAGDKATSLVSVTKPTKFLSYMQKGDDSQIVLTFDGDISSMESCYIDYGDIENADTYYRENLTPNIQANVVTIELGGKQRRQAQMVTTTPANPNVISVQLHGIRDINGNIIYTGDDASLGSIAYIFPYEELPAADISSELTPMDNNQAELYIVNEKSISYTGVRLSYINSQRNDFNKVISTVLPMSEVNKEYEKAAGEETPNAILTFTIPEDYRTQKDVIVTLDGLESADGLNYMMQTTNHLNALDVTFTPAEGSQFETVPADQLVTLSYPGIASTNYIQWCVRDLNPEDPSQDVIKDIAPMTWNETEGRFEGLIPREFTLYSDHNYRVEIHVWNEEMSYNYDEAPMGRASLYWVGTHAPYVYSTAAYDYIIPEQGFELDGKQDQVFTVYYTEPVRITAGRSLGSGAGVASASNIVPGDADETPVEVDGQKYAKVWNFTFTAADIKASGNAMTVVLTAFDPDGHIVRGTNGTKDTSNVQVDYVVTANNFIPETSVKDGDELDAFTGITFTYQDKVIDQTNTATTPVQLYKNRNEFVCDLMFVADEHYYDEGYQNKACTYRPYDTNTWKYYDITEPGSYTIVVPSGLLRIGEQFDTQDSGRMQINFTIKGETPDALALNIESKTLTDGTDADHQTMTITFKEVVYPEWNLKPTIKVGDQPAENVVWDVLYDDPNDWDSVAHAITLNIEKSKLTGAYTITVPDGMLCADENLTKPYKGFVISSTNAIENLTTDANAAVEVYDLNGRRLPSTQGLTPGIYIMRQGTKTYKTVIR